MFALHSSACRPSCLGRIQAPNEGALQNRCTQRPGAMAIRTTPLSYILKSLPRRTVGVKFTRSLCGIVFPTNFSLLFGMEEFITTPSFYTTALR